MEPMVDFYRRLLEAKMKLRDALDERGRPEYATRDGAASALTGDPR